MLGLCVVMTDAVMLRVLIQCLADVLTVWYTSWNIKKKFDDFGSLLSPT